MYGTHLPASPRSQDAMRPARTDRRGIDVLLVDDDDKLRGLLVMALRRAGFRVQEARHGEEALTELDAGPARLLLTDVVMPGMNGCELAERATNRRPDVRVVFMSGSAGPVLPRASGFLQKPFRMGAMVAEVRRVLAAA